MKELFKIFDNGQYFHFTMIMRGVFTLSFIYSTLNISWNLIGAT